MNRLSRGALTASLMAGALYLGVSGIDGHGALRSPEGSGVEGPSTDGLAPEIVYTEPQPEQTVCGALSVLRASVEHVSDETHPLVGIDERDFGSAYPLPTALGQFEQTVIAEHPELGQDTSSEGLELLADVESVRATTELVIDAPDQGMETVGLADQARDTINVAAARFCLENGSLAQEPGDYVTGPLAGSLTCKVITGGRAHVKDQLDWRGYVDYGSSTLPEKVPTTQTPTTSVPRIGYAPGVPTMSDVSTLLDAAFTQEFPDFVSGDSALPEESISLTTARLLNVEASDISGLLAVERSLAGAASTYCNSWETRDVSQESPATTSTIPVNPEQPATPPTTSTTEATVVDPSEELPQAPPAQPITDEATVTG